MKIKTNRLTGVQLDWAVAQCEKHEVKFECNLLFFSDKLQMLDYGIVYHPSKDWEYGGPIIEREVINIGRQAWDDNGVINWGASKSGLFQGAPFSVGPTPLVAAMRCYVASKLGEEVEIPEEVCDEHT